ncbi:class I SAM-dependent methyltransferase [Candidatus Saccharibacteria bacterium]|nr:class I SAM-dependent methyltransferase [Candidatus Saccharibacteria bacterium]MBR3138918.1 class I SAM-dependent methyltransferase [Candidatus Saccharibacteria bacterium]
MSWKNDQVSKKETGKIVDFAKRCLNIEGDFVEMGCYKGDTSLILAEILREYNMGKDVEKYVENPVEKMGKSMGKHVERCASGKIKKQLWIYDSFEGLPDKSLADESVLGVDFKAGELFVTKREVKDRFLRAGLKVPIIKKGWFSELKTNDLPETVAFAFLDGDFYESIRDSLELVGPRMNKNGILVVHDYTNPALPGVRKAVDEWTQKNSVDFILEIC